MTPSERRFLDASISVSFVLLGFFGALVVLGFALRACSIT